LHGDEWIEEGEERQWGMSVLSQGQYYLKGETPLTLADQLLREKYFGRLYAFITTPLILIELRRYIRFHTRFPLAQLSSRRSFSSICCLGGILHRVVVTRELCAHRAFRLKFSPKRDTPKLKVQEKLM
jgi:hypothetical protein